MCLACVSACVTKHMPSGAWTSLGVGPRLSPYLRQFLFLLFSVVTFAPPADWELLGVPLSPPPILP